MRTSTCACQHLTCTCPLLAPLTTHVCFKIMCKKLNLICFIYAIKAPLISVHVSSTHGKMHAHVDVRIFLSLSVEHQYVRQSLLIQKNYALWCLFTWFILKCLLYIDIMINNQKCIKWFVFLLKSYTIFVESQIWIVLKMSVRQCKI